MTFRKILSLFIFILVLCVLVFPVLAADGSISGTVYQTDGVTELSGAEVILEDASHNGIDSQVTGGPGTYSFTVPPGTYYITVKALGYAQQYYDGKLVSNIADAINVGDGEPVTLNNIVMQPGGSVSGRITDSSSSLYIEQMGVNATFYDPGTGMSWGRGACTDINGDYTLDNLPLDIEFRINTGSHTTSDVGCSGPTNYVWEYYNDVHMQQDAQVFTLTSGTPILNGIDFQLDPGGTITGKITDQNTGQPVPNMRVELGMPHPIGFGTCTASDGTYTFSGIPFNTDFIVSTGDENWCGGANNYVEEFYGETFNRNAAAIVQVTGSQPTRTNINIAIEKGGTVTGKVTDQATGNPIPNINVSVNFPSGYGFGSCTDSSGNYTSRILPFNREFNINAAGPYNFCTQETNTYIQELWQETKDWGQAQMLTLSTSSPTRSGINFTLQEGVLVSGTIYKQDGITWIDAPNFSVQASPPGQTHPFESSVYINLPPGMTPTYAFPVLPGTYNLWAQADGYAREFYKDAGGDPEGATLIVVNAGQPVSGIDFSLAPGGTISGTVTDNQGNPIVNMGVDIAEGAYGFCTDDNGHYAVTSLPLGRSYVIRTGAWNFCGQPNNYPNRFYPGVKHSDDAIPISLTQQNRNVSGINFQLTPGGTISGRITDATNGQGIPNANLAMVLPETPPWLYQRINTNEDGTYLFEGIEPGQYTVMTNADGYATTWYNPAGSTPRNWRATVITLKPGDVLENINVAMGLGGSISGQVIDSSTNQPISGIHVRTNGSYGAGCTDENGNYAIFGLPRGIEIVVSAAHEPPFCNPPDNDDYLEEFYEESPNIDGATRLVLTDAAPIQDNINFTLGKIAASTLPTNLVVSGTSQAPVIPQFQWTHLPVSEETAKLMGIDLMRTSVPGEWYQVVLKNTSGETLLEKWYRADRICNGVRCTVYSNIQLYAEGEYSWQVNVWAPATGVLSSDAATFTVDLPAPGIPQNLVVDTSSGRPLITWDADPYAAYYRVIIIGADGQILHDQWYEKSEIDCDDVSCTLLPDAHPINGDYTVKISAWGPGGFSGGDPEAASAPVSFEVDKPPSGTVDPATFAITNTWTGSPTFAWTPAENATWHLLWVGQLTPTTLTYHITWYPVSTMDCPNGPENPCTITPSTMFLAASDIPYDVWTLSWGPGGTNESGQFLGWSHLGEFMVEVEAPQPAAPLTPTGLTATSTPAFSWKHVNRITWYNLWVGQTGENNSLTTLHWQWYRATEIGCFTGICSVDPEDFYLPEGDYIWYLQTYNPAYNILNQPWSEAGQFTVKR